MNNTRPDCLQWELILLDFKNWISFFFFHFSSSHITQKYSQRPIIRLWPHLFHSFFKCLWYISPHLPFLTTPFPSSMNNPSLMIFNHFLLQEFVNPKVLSDYFTLIMSEVCSEWCLILDSVETDSCYVFLIWEAFALWLNLSINYICPLIRRKVPWVMLKYLLAT